MLIKHFLTPFPPPPPLRAGYFFPLHVPLRIFAFSGFVLDITPRNFPRFYFVSPVFLPSSPPKTRVKMLMPNFNPQNPTIEEASNDFALSLFPQTISIGKPCLGFIPVPFPSFPGIFRIQEGGSQVLFPTWPGALKHPADKSVSGTLQLFTIDVGSYWKVEHLLNSVV